MTVRFMKIVDVKILKKMLKMVEFGRLNIALNDGIIKFVAGAQ